MTETALKPNRDNVTALQDALIIKLNGKAEVVIQSIDEYEKQLEIIAYYKYKEMIADSNN